MANVNSIRCCGFDKAYKALTNSRKGCLSDKELYGTALLSYQIDALASYSPDVCLTQEQYDNLYQKLSLGCGCCSSNVNDPEYDTNEETIRYWYLDIYSAPDNTFDDWTIDGLPFLSNYTNLTGFGSNEVNGNNPIAFYDERYIWQVSKQSDLPEIPVYEDSFGNPYAVSWQQGSSGRTCWEGIVAFDNLIMSQFTLGILQVTQIDSIAAFSVQVDVSNPTHIGFVQTYYRSVFGNQVTITSVPNIDGDYVVTISNTYESFGPIWGGFLGTVNFYEITC